MIDIKKLKSNFEDVANNLENRGASKDDLKKAVDYYNERTSLLAEIDALKHQRNEVSNQIGVKKRNGEDAEDEIQEMRELGTKIEDIDTKVRNLEAKEFDIMSGVPNLGAEGVPVGEDEDSNEEIHRNGKQTSFGFEPKAHYELGEELGILDFENGARVAGSRFLYYVGMGARLERAVYNFMLDQQHENGYVEMIPPYLVNDNAMYGTGQYPKFTEDTYRVDDIDDRRMTLIPTSEVPLTNYFGDNVWEKEKLPFKVTALSPCFRSEAGSAGRDTRGLIRLHQFHKVEMVRISKPEESFEQLEEMTENGEAMLEKLGLPYRRVVLSTGDMGFSATKTYDIEVWMPNQDTYREISSCSNCYDFQARRAKIRYRNDEGRTQLAHTLNGSGLAVGRTVAAIIENYQTADGSIAIPEALVPYMSGVTQINKENALGKKLINHNHTI
ncbi:serine--tRNA ligase [Tetragenococcus halophilus]|uniref:serine--tRNA ligase n=1 Tax=Tetragenococcus halophilus TaxID=51669 RepID=UPI00264AE6A3|nr:serine--tRNA ligase [Tetragenococcus koreensis]MDN6749016.1 serine--tRNA ligase [Staphylococcus equorum]MDN6839834.1 serine--tRNA ligase [Tetragenococcus halophilus]